MSESFPSAAGAVVTATAPQMEHYGNLQILDNLPETGDDLVDDKQIRAYLPTPDIVEHRNPFSDSSRDIWDAVQVEQWKFIRPLGRGGFGRVHLEEKILERFSQSQGSRPQLRAVKIILKRDGGLRTMQHLPEILSMAKFFKLETSFLQLFAWFQIDSEICIAMEWAPYGDLEDCVLKPLPEVQVQEVVRQISLAVVIMHERRFLHRRDLKLKNVFVFRKQPESSEWRVKLGDFGVSKRVRDAVNTSWHTCIEADCSAPEVLGLLGGDYAEESSYASSVDMWSLGYLAHWLLTKRYPLSKFALPQYCRQMDSIPLSELANEGVSNQVVDFVKNLLHLTPATRMTAQERLNLPKAWCLGPVIGRIRGHRPLYAPSDDYRDFSQEAAPFLTDSDHQIEHASSDNRSAQAPDLEKTQEEVVARRQKKHKAEMQETVRAKIQEAAQRPRERKEDHKPHPEAEKRQRGRKALQPKVEDEQEEREPDPVDVLYSPGGKTVDIVQPIAGSRKNTDIQPMNDDEIDDDALEAEFATLEAEEALREEEHMKKKAAEKEANRKREEKEAAANDANLKEAESKAEEEEIRREEERNQRQASGSAGDNKRLFEELRSGNHDETEDFGGVNSEAIDFAATLSQDDSENLNAERGGNARTEMPLQELDLLKQFREFAMAEKQKALERKRTQSRQDRDRKLSELLQFSKNFKLSKPPPPDLIGVLAKDPAKQKAIIDSCNRQAELLQRPKWFQSLETAQSESAKHLSENMDSSQQTSVEPHPRPSRAQVAASDVPVQEPAKKTSTDTKHSKSQKKRRGKLKSECVE